MCGLAGWVDYTRKLDDEFPAIFAMTNTLALRGPDAEGIWKHRNALLGHRRLAVIDLSGGVQPMSYRFPTGQEVTLVYTGEVYNHDALRERLRRAGHEFRTRSDTEVVLHAYLQWGERCCEYLTGMFAFAVFDGRDGHLLLVRDRLGIKPLYYARHREGLLFGSEIKSILAHPEFAARLDAVGLVDLLTLSRGLRRRRSARSRNCCPATCCPGVPIPRRSCAATGRCAARSMPTTCRAPCSAPANWSPAPWARNCTPTFRCVRCYRVGSIRPP